MNRLIGVGLVVLLLTGGCGVQTESRNDLSFGGNATVENGTFHLEGELRLGQGAAPDHNYSDVRVVLYDADRQEITSVAVGRMSTEPQWGPTEREVNVTSDVVPTYVVVESPDFWTDGEIEVVSLWIHDGTYHRYGRTGPDDETFPCEVSGLQVDAPHCDRTSERSIDRRSRRRLGGSPVYFDGPVERTGDGFRVQGGVGSGSTSAMDRRYDAGSIEGLLTIEETE